MNPIDVILLAAGAVLIGIGTGSVEIGMGVAVIGAAIIPAKRGH